MRGSMVGAHDLGDNSQLCQARPICPGSVSDDSHLVTLSRPNLLKPFGGHNILPGRVRARTRNGQMMRRVTERDDPLSPTPW